VLHWNGESWSCSYTWRVTASARSKPSCLGSAELNNGKGIAGMLADRDASITWTRVTRVPEKWQ
jgi:hypothetical protein